MASKKEVLSGLIILIAVLVTLLALSYIGVIQNLMSAIEQVITGVLASVFGGGLLLILKGIRRKDERVPEFSSKKKKGIVSRLRFSIRKERRVDIAQTAITSVIFGPILIIVILSIIQSQTLAPQAILPVTFITITSICVGIGLTIWGALLLSNLLLDTWEARQGPIRQRRKAYLIVTKDFDNAFEAVQQVSDTTTKRIMLNDFQSQLSKLIEYEWNQVKDRIEKVLDSLIPEKFSDDPYVKLHIQFLAMIIDKYGQTVIEKISKKWLKEFERMYNDPDYRTDNISVIFDIFQELHGYDENFLESLIDDSTRWTQIKFSLLLDHIGFSELRKRDEVAYNGVLQYLRRKMDDAGQNKNDEAFKRLEMLYSIAKR
jgi:hypothetical protein